MTIGGGGAGSQEFELNLASIIDCFTVLITFMLASASFLSIGILDAGVAAAGATSSTESKSQPVSVTLKKDATIELKVGGKASTVATLEELEPRLRGLGSVDAVTLSGEGDVEYGEIVKAMERVRRVIPAVILGGF